MSPWQLLAFRVVLIILLLIVLVKEKGLQRIQASQELSITTKSGKINWQLLSERGDGGGIHMLS